MLLIFVLAFHDKNNEAEIGKEQMKNISRLGSLKMQDENNNYFFIF